MAPELVERVMANIQAALASGQVQTLEYSLPLADGLRDYEARCVASGPDEVVVIVRDITERKRAEQALREKEEQYRSIFEASNDGLFINDLNGRLVDFNSAAALMHGYTVEEFRRLQPAQFVHPESLPVFDDFLQTVRAGRVFRGRAADVRKDGSQMPVEVLGTSFTLRGQPHILAVVRDIAEQVRAYDVLEQRVEERTRELATLLHVSRHLTSTFELGPVLGEFLDHIRDVIDYQGASIFSLEGDQLQARAYRGPLAEAQVLQMRYSARNAFDQQIIATRQPLILADLHEEAPQADAFRQWVGPEFAGVYSTIRSWMRVPLTAKERVIGMLTLYHAEPGYFSNRHAELTLAFADQVAAAMENARLFDAVQRRAEQFRVIGEMSYRIASILAVDELLGQTVHLIRETFGYYHVHIGLVEDGHVLFPRQAGLWRDEGLCLRCEAFKLRVGQDGLSGRVAGSGEPILVHDVSRDSRYIETVPGQTGSALVLPLKVKGQVIGVLDIESEQPNAFDAGDMTVLQSFANQTAVAIENARLYEHSQQLAALEERQKLARELHDSVSQALYGIALGARTARTQLDRQPDKAAEPLEYVLALSEAALAEMRALIFELRPESLEVEGLTAALERQAASLRARHRFEVQTALAGEPDAPLEVKQALCRIAQEALHNIVKHAQASRVALLLNQSPDGLTLEVHDNGRGFDSGGSFPGHLGLKSMRERAERLGGALSIDSRPDEGCRLRAWIPLHRAPG
jgi:PAS domain S-box-containing protein